MKNEPKRCPVCTLSIGHADDCRYRASATLSATEDAYWRAGFAQGDGDPAAADRMLRKYRAHLADDVPSLLKDPSLPEQSATASLGHGRLLDSDIVDAISKELGNRGLPTTEEPG